MNNKEQLQQVLGNEEDCLIVRDSSVEIGDIISSVGIELGNKILSAYACNPNDLGYPADNIQRRGRAIGCKEWFPDTTKLPPMWANEANQSPNTLYLLHVEHLQECTKEQLAEWRAFLESRTICGLKLENVLVCAEYVIYPDVENPKTNLDEVDFFDAEIHWEVSTAELWKEIHEKLDGQVPYDFIALFEKLQVYWESPLLLSELILGYQKLAVAIKGYELTDAEDIKEKLEDNLLPSVDPNSIEDELQELAEAVYEYISKVSDK